ncbi:MAG: hypothetical protein VKK59_03960, partial [Vampirovibrionales bacterium]|nr:hypothetical protein [Vampirovibrionales bacterium]
MFAQPSKTLSPHPPGVSAGFSLIEVGLTLTIIAALASTGILGWNDFSENSTINSVRVVRAALQTTIAQSIDAFETPTTAMPAANLLNQLRANSLLQNGVVITPLGANVSDGFTVTINNNGVS